MEIPKTTSGRISALTDLAAYLDVPSSLLDKAAVKVEAEKEIAGYRSYLSEMGVSSRQISKEMRHTILKQSLYIISARKASHAADNSGWFNRRLTKEYEALEAFYLDMFLYYRHLTNILASMAIKDERKVVDESRQLHEAAANALRSGTEAKRIVSPGILRTRRKR